MRCNANDLSVIGYMLVMVFDRVMASLVMNSRLTSRGFLGFSRNDRGSIPSCVSLRLLASPYASRRGGLHGLLRCSASSLRWLV